MIFIVILGGNVYKYDSSYKMRYTLIYFNICWVLRYYRIKFQMRLDWCVNPRQSLYLTSYAIPTD